MAKVFVSYSRKDIEFAKRLTGELQKSDLDFWIDWEGIPPTVDWWREIEKGIEEADAFLFLISPDSARSKICGQEINTAVKNGKRIIPVVIREIEWQDTPPQLGRLNYIFFTRDDNFETAVGKLINAIHTDYEWAATHRRIQVKALEWERKNRESSLLLHGRDLQDAEAQITINVSKSPKPTELQTQYIHASRQGESRRQRNLLSGVGIALVLSVGLGILAFINGQKATQNANNFATQVVIAQSESNFRATEQARAEEQTRIAIARSLATGARLNFDKEYDLSLLMAAKSLNLDNSIEAKAALFDGLEYYPQAVKYFNLGFQAGYSDYSGRFNGLIDFSRDGRYIAAHTVGPDIYLIDLEADGVQPTKLAGNSANILTLQFNGSKDELYSLDEKGTLIRWNIQTMQPKVEITSLFSEDVGGSAFQVAISKTGDSIALVNEDEIRIWDISANSLAQKISLGSALGGMPVTFLTFSPDGQRVAAGAFYKAVAWDIGSGSVVPNASIDTGRPVTSIALSPDGNFFAAGSTDGFVHIKNLETGEQRDQPESSNGANISTGQAITTDITGHKDEIGSLVFSPDSQMLVSAGNDQTFIVWDTWHWPLQGPVNIHHAPVIGVAFNPVSGVMASLDTQGSLILWDTAKSSNLLIYGDNEKIPLDLVEGQSLTPEDCERIVNQPESSCFVSPNAKLMISASIKEAYGAYDNSRARDSVVGIWDLESQQLIGQYDFFSYEPSWVMFSVDNKYARMDGVGYASSFMNINIDVSSWASIACAIANRNFSRVEWDRYVGYPPYNPTCP